MFSGDKTFKKYSPLKNSLWQNCHSHECGLPDIKVSLNSGLIKTSFLFHLTVAFMTMKKTIFIYSTSFHQAKIIRIIFVTTFHDISVSTVGNIKNSHGALIPYGKNCCESSICSFLSVSLFAYAWQKFIVPRPVRKNFPFEL